MAKLSDEAVLKDATHGYRVAVRQQAKWKRDAKQAFRFYAGDQLNEDDKHKLEQEKRPVVTFNMIGPNVRAVVGIQAANRTEIRYSAPDGQDPATQGFADWANKLLKRCDEACDAEMEVSESFKDTVICGMGWTQRTIDFETDPKGIMVKRSIDPLRKWWDPAAKRHNLVDRKFDFTEVFIDKWEFKKLYPDAEDEVATVGVEGTASGGGDPFSVGGEEHDQFDTEVEHEEAQDPYRGDRSSPDGYERLKDKVRLIEYNYWRWKSSYLVMREAGDTLIDEDGWSAFKKGIEAQGFQTHEIDADVDPAILEDSRQVLYKRVNEKRFYKAIFRGASILAHNENIDPAAWNEHCITADLDRATGLWYGIVRPMIDPQLWSSKLFMQIMLVVMSNPKGGLFYKKGAFARPDQAREDYAGASPMIEVKLGETQTFDQVIHERQPGVYPQGLHELMAYASGIIPRVTGLNMELLGMAQKDQPGILEHLRQQAGMTILASLFDSLRAYHKLDARTALYLMRHEVPAKRQAEILGAVQQQLIQAVGAAPSDLDAYMVTVDESPYSPNRKMLIFKMLTDMGTTNPEMQSLVFPEILDWLPNMPQDVVTRLKQKVEQQGKSQQASQQQQEQMSAAQILAKLQEMLSHAQLYRAQAAAAEAEIGNETASAVTKGVAELADAASKIGSAHAAKADAVLTHAQAKAVTKPGAESASGPTSALTMSPLKTGGE